MDLNTILLALLNKRLSRLTALIPLLVRAEVEFADELLVVCIKDILLVLHFVGEQIVVSDLMVPLAISNIPG